jgi:hypothetical protein
MREVVERDTARESVCLTPRQAARSLGSTWLRPISPDSKFLVMNLALIRPSLSEVVRGSRLMKRRQALKRRARDGAGTSGGGE